MSRTLAYSVSLALFFGATALTTSSLFLPTWITTPEVEHLPTISQGLRRLCTDGSCTAFPTPQQCLAASNRITSTTTSLPNFCPLWRSASFLISLSLVLELVTLLTFTLILSPITMGISGETKIRQGWKLLLPMMAVVMAFEVAAVSITGYVFEKDDAYFPPFWKLGAAWGCAMGSWVLAGLAAGGLWVAMFVVGRREEKMGVEGRGDVFDSLLRGRADGEEENGERGLSYGT